MTLKPRRPGPLSARFRTWVVVAGVTLAVGGPVGAAADPVEPDSRSSRRVEVETVEECFTAPPGALPTLELTTPSDARKGRLRIGDRRVPLEDVLFVRFGASEGSTLGASTLYLNGGGEVAGEVAGGDADSVLWRNALLSSEPIRISLDDVRGIVFGAARPADAVVAPESGGAAPVPSIPSVEDEAREDAIRTRLHEEIRSRRPKSDVIVLREGGRLDGIYEGLTSGSIRFNSDSLGSVGLPVHKVRALFFASLEGEPEGARGGTGAANGSASPRSAAIDPFRVGVILRDESYLPGRVQSWDATQLRIAQETLGALEIGVAAVAEVAFPGGRARFLSDLTPSSAREDTGVLFRLKMPHRNDASVLGTPLRMQGKEYRKGVGVHAFSSLQYALQGEFRRFRATIGLDDTARPPSGLPGRETMGAVTFRVRVDGKRLFEKDMTWRDDPIPIDLPVTDGRVLELEVDFGNDASGTQMARDRANWAEARVIR